MVTNSTSEHNLATATIDNFQMTLRLLRKHEVADIAKLDHDFFPSPWTQESFAKEMQNSISTTYVVECDTKIIAYAVVWYIVDEMQIAKIAVIPAFQKRGLATWMMQEIFRKAAAQNIKHAFLEVRRSNKSAIALYRKFGFSISGERHDYYDSPKEDAFLMTAHI